MPLRTASHRPLRALPLLLLLALPGCSIDVKNGRDGEDKRVHIDTPLGNLLVNADSPAPNLGIGVYPGAVPAPDHDGDHNADIRMGFGRWQMRVKVAHYSSRDPEARVLAWYRSDLARHGDVIECRGDQPVGTPARTAEGLTCAEDEHAGRVHLPGHDRQGHDRQDLTLRAGSRHRQYMVSFEDKDSAQAGPTPFTLIALELPEDEAKRDRQTD